MIFYTQNTGHITASLTIPQGKRLIKTFSDGELYVRIQESVQGLSVWIMGSTLPPGDSLIELMLLLDALQRGGARIQLLVTYLGYARQDRAATGEPLSAEVMLNCFRQFQLKRVVVVHPHSSVLKKYLPFENYLPLPFFTSCAQAVDCVVAPDHGARELAIAVGKMAHKPVAFLEKTRPAQEQVVLASLSGELHGTRALIVDDMIATGRTLCAVAQLLAERYGFTDIHAAATHGLFVNGAPALLQASPIKKITVTNTLKQQDSTPLIDVYPIAPLLQSYVIA